MLDAGAIDPALDDARGSAVGPGSGVTAPPRDAAVAPDAGPVVASPVRITVFPPKGSQLQIGDGEWLAVPDSGVVAAAIDRDVVVRAQNPCCGDESVSIKVGQSQATIALRLKPAIVVASCEGQTPDVRIDGKSAGLGTKMQIFFDESLIAEKTIEVEFIFADRAEKRPVTVRSGKTQTVTCAKP